MVQVDVYRLDKRLERSFETDGGRLYDTMCGIAGRRVDSLVNFVLGDVSVMRVDLGRHGFAVLERLS
ncbi:hypothetical protein [Glacieibacterium frigidum]|uniref:Uncharacterized protein n=1 Tax=Glacieibacterium frigidum TaxID=2593303 RepID=A0A552U919_9SPHN|nr:hypothetical protein [Glacieibacterium frigidum]TRW14711.1 hypothetical protein FMM06_13570 [Glacieibacterium frigidum]